MVDDETYCRIRIHHKEQGLTFNQIGRELGIDPETAAKYAALDTFPRRRSTKRTSKLDPFKPDILGVKSNCPQIHRASSRFSISWRWLRRLDRARARLGGGGQQFQQAGLVSGGVGDVGEAHAGESHGFAAPGFERLDDVL